MNMIVETKGGNKVNYSMLGKSYRNLNKDDLPSAHLIYSTQADKKLSSDK
jgi:hypothetical protein